MRTHRESDDSHDADGWWSRAKLLPSRSTFRDSSDPDAYRLIPRSSVGPVPGQICVGLQWNTLEHAQKDRGATLIVPISLDPFVCTVPRSLSDSAECFPAR